MNQSDQLDDAGTLLLKVVIAIVLLIAVIENGLFFLVFFWVDFVSIPIIFGLSYYLHLWLRFSLRDAQWALLGTAVAGAAWPWTWWLLLQMRLPDQRPISVEIAWLFGPAIPYALMAAVGLWKTRTWM